MLRKILLTLAFILFSFSFAFAQDDFETDNVKLQLFIQKGMKAEARRNYDEALEAYEEAHENFSKNFLPIVKIAGVYVKTGMYKDAERYLNKIPIELLNENGQSEIYTLLGKLAIYRDDLGSAGENFRKAYKVLPDNLSAKIRLAMVNLMSGMISRSEEIVRDEVDFSQYLPDELRLALALDLNSCNFGRAYSTCELLGKTYIDANPKSDFITLLQKQAFFLFISYFPLFLNRTLSIVYFAILFAALGVVATKLSKKANMVQAGTFVFIGVALLALCQKYCIQDVYKAILLQDFFSQDGIWILPKILIASNLIAISLFFIFPMFRVLPDSERPLSYELLGIWLFCFFFSIFVLSFQSDLSVGARFTYMSIGMFCSLLSCLIMPLGRFALYKLTGATGLKKLNKVSTNIIDSNNISFTDAKILSDQTWKFIFNGDILNAEKIWKKALNPGNRTSLPYFWIAMIAGKIFKEEYEDAGRELNAFSSIFQGTDEFETGQIYESLLKSEKGDFSTAYKLINAISDSRAKKMTPEETAVSFLVLARCCQNIKDNVQAHINLTKALQVTKSSILKLMILCELTELDCKLNSRSAVEKWKSETVKVGNTGKCASYKNTILSMIADYYGQENESMNMAKKCLELNHKNGKAFYWYGHLLLKHGNSSEAEEMLGRMSPQTYEAEKLMTELTTVV